MRQVVCGIDGSPAAFAAATLAREIARQAELPLEVLHASCAGVEAEQLARARTLQGRLRQGVGPVVLLRVEVGHPEVRLIEASRRASLLVIATRGGGAVRRALSGSVTSTVTRFAAAPVLVVPRRALIDGVACLGAGAVVCAIRDERDLPCAATAACWARELGRPLRLVHVVPPRRMPATAVGMPPPEVLTSTADRRAGGRRMLDQIAGTIAPIAPRVCGTRVLDGAVGPHLVRFAAAEEAALVAVGRPRSLSLAAALTRSPTTHLLRRAPCPVMVCPSPEAVLATACAASREVPAALRAPGLPGP
jgi:nucleotide-binding universal stress UspA family protein